MCISIAPVNEDDKIEICFFVERILQRRNGGANISLDLLVKNVGSQSVDRLRFAVPYSLVEVQRLEDMQEEEAAKETEKLIREQASLCIIPA